MPPPNLPAPDRRRTRSARLLLLAMGLACATGAAVLAAPLPPPRPRPPVLVPLAPTTPTTPLESACGSAIDQLPDALAQFAEHAATGPVPLPTTHSRDIGDVAVLEDDGTFFFNDKNGNANLDVAAVGRAFYRLHGDDYDEIAVWLTSGLSNWLGSPTALAAAWILRNDVSGIGLSLYDDVAALGLPPRLRVVLTMNGLHRYPDDPAAEVPGLPRYVTQDVLAHEFGHEWLAYPWVLNPWTFDNAVLLGRAFQHWSFFFDADGSVMEGADWQVVEPDSFVGLEPIARYGPVDQYLMGLRDRSEVDSFFVISDTARITPEGAYNAISDPQLGMTARGPGLRFAVDDLENANGPRVPDAANSSHHRRVAFVLVVPHGSEPLAAELAKLETIRTGFPLTMQAYTGGRLTVDASLASRPGRIRLEHLPAPDLETPFAPIALALRATVDAGGLPLHVRPDGVSVGWRTDPSALWTMQPMIPTAPDSFVAVLPGRPLGSTVEYWFRAESDSVGLRTDMPELSHSLPFALHVAADTNAPEIVHWALHDQSDRRLPQTLLARVHDRFGVDSVWFEYHVNEGPQLSLPVNRAGRDSFLVSVGGGLPRGARLEYRFAARDRSQAANVGYSNPAFDTLHVGADVVDDFWNPAPWFHANVRFNRRDEWHTVMGPSTPGGSGAWHCGLDSLPYGPYQDAALMSPPIFDIVPGTEWTFTHRWSLEDSPGGLAYDGARVEVLGSNGIWEAATPLAGYTHIMALGDQGLPPNAECWSGEQPAWRSERVDLTPWAPGPVRVRFRMSTDLFLGRGGWWVDDVRIRFPGGRTVSVGAPPEALEASAPWPNPSHGELRQSLRLGQRATLDWALHDIAGRRVGTLWRGALTPGSHELLGRLPASLAPGLYFTRLSVDGRALATRRVALVR